MRLIFKLFLYHIKKTFIPEALDLQTKEIESICFLKDFIDLCLYIKTYMSHYTHTTQLVEEIIVFLIYTLSKEGIPVTKKAVSHLSLVCSQT